MPPEQATGAQSTPRSDLYSLGAMLYELTTGRPPFIADDTIGIIGQPLNVNVTPPVYHRAELPGSLNLLIVRLLEKDPARRPGATADVLEALEAIRAGREPAMPLTDDANWTDAGFALHPFVGRQAELGQLRNAFDTVLAGQGALAMVVGEPGIGKTTLCDQLGAYVREKGGRILSGHCYEGGSSLARYLPFVEALREYVAHREVDALRLEFGAGAADIATLVPEL